MGLTEPRAVSTPCLRRHREPGSAIKGMKAKGSKGFGTATPSHSHSPAGPVWGGGGQPKPLGRWGTTGRAPLASGRDASATFLWTGPALILRVLRVPPGRLRS